MKDRQGLHRVFISIGSNLGNRKEHIEQSMTLVGKKIGRIIRLSGIFESGAWGFQSENRFYNICLEMETALAPGKVMHYLLQIEDTMGRDRAGDRYQDRIIDLDLLFYDDLILDTPDLVLPHPGIPDRRFVLLPLAEIAPGFVHPILQKSIAELLTTCQDRTDIEPV